MEPLNIESLKDIQECLKSDLNRISLISHPVLKAFKTDKLNHNQVAVILGQWYYPLNNFPYFLSSSIAHVKVGSIQTFISDILHEELGCGDPAMSHLDLYKSTMIDAGFTLSEVSEAPPLQATTKLINGYKAAAKSQNGALGFIYATEVADLAMVSSIGYAVGNYCNKLAKDLPWVDIHVVQEPNHVNKVDASLDVSLTETDVNEIINNARYMWQLWTDFFNEIGNEINLN